MKKGKKGQNVTAPPGAAEKLKDLGNQSFSNGNFQKAIELYTQAIEIEKNAIYYSNRSYAYFELRLYKQSLEDAEIAININKEYAKGYLRKAYALRELDAIAEALEAARKGCELAGKNEVFDKLLEEIEKEYKEVIYRHLVNKYAIQRTISVIHDLDDPEIVKINELCDWLKKGGAIFPKLKIKYYEKNYRGVHSAQSIKANELILYVPKSHLITLEMAKETPVGKKIAAAGLALLSPKHSYLSTFLLDEKFNPSSWWRPYINMLPTDFDSMPIFFPEDDLMWLEGSPFLDQVREKKSDIKKDYDAILEVAPEFSKYSFWEFCWARMNACSRIFGINIDGVKTDAFVPLADMLNHRIPKQASWSYSDEKKGFIIESLEDIQRGGQAYDSYGKKCNSRFLLNYGFILLENDGNEVAVKAGYKSDDPFLKAKASLIKENLQSKTFRVMGNVEEKNTLEFLSFLRFVNIRDQQTLLEIMNNQVSEEPSNEQAYKPQETPPLSIEIEKRVLENCKKICEEQLERYPTSLKEDLDLLKTDKLTTNQRNCVLLRSGEKEILHYLIKFAEDCAPLLALSSKEIRKLLTQNPYIKYADYINKAIHTVVQRRENGIKSREMDLKYLSPEQMKDLGKFLKP